MGRRREEARIVRCVDNGDARLVPPRSKGTTTRNKTSPFVLGGETVAIGLRTELPRIAKFSVVGLTGVGVYTGTLWVIVEFGKAPYILAAVAAMELSISHNFFWNHVWTFGRDLQVSNVLNTLWRWLEFHASRVGSAIIGMGLLVLLTESFGLYYLVSGLVAIPAAALCNYATSRCWVWGR